MAIVESASDNPPLSLSALYSATVQSFDAAIFLLLSAFFALSGAFCAAALAHPNETLRGDDAHALADLSGDGEGVVGDATYRKLSLTDTNNGC